MEHTAVQNEVLQLAAAAKAASIKLANATDEQRRNALLAAAENIERRSAEILSANAEDMSNAEELAKEGKLSSSLISRLKLDKSKLGTITDGLRQVAALPDLLWQRTLATELDDGLILERITCPIGVIAVIFESRPDALPQISSLCIKSNNAVILKGGSEATKTNRVLFDCIKDGAKKGGLPDGILALLESRESVQTLLNADKYVDLIIPRGSNELVRSIQSNTHIPVLGHAEGLCHLYVDSKADLDKAVRLAVDSKAQYPAACNAIETLLVHKDIAAEFVPKLMPKLRERGVEVRVHDNIRPHLKDIAEVKFANDSDWHTEYCDLILSIKQVDSLDAAIAHINDFGSHHTDCIVTEDKAAADKFFAQVNSGGVYCNASTRFADGFRYGFGAEVGISTGKLHPRGPVGLEGLVTYKYKLLGNGQVVADYTGESARQFKHKKLSP